MAEKETLHVGCAAGFSGDRVDAAGPVVDSLVAAGKPAYLIYETLAERTLAFAHLARRSDPNSGYEPLLEDMLSPVLAKCLSHDVRIVSNFGAANPHAAAQLIRKMAIDQGIKPPRIAVVSGDDVSGPEHRSALHAALANPINASHKRCTVTGDIISANAYQGGDGIANALRAGAQIVVAARVSDPSLTVGPLMAHFGWREDDWLRLGRGVVAGHLLECGAQVTGGYFADPGYKDVTNLHDVGFPIVEIDMDGHCTVTKANNTGGCVNEHTVKEQILYEVHDPAAYLAPDAVADVSQCQVHQVGPDRVRIDNALGHERPAKLKVNVYYDGGWLAEGEISYAGPRAEGRARLAADVLRKRLGSHMKLRVDLIGSFSVFADDGGRREANTALGQVRDIRLRVAASHPDRRIAQMLTREVNALHTCGPAAGGGVRVALRRRLSMQSCLIDRKLAPTSFEMID